MPEVTLEPDSTGGESQKENIFNPKKNSLIKTFFLLSPTV
jgi:hypothetical protein